MPTKTAEFDKYGANGVLPGQDGQSLGYFKDYGTLKERDYGWQAFGGAGAAGAAADGHGPGGLGGTGGDATSKIYDFAVPASPTVDELGVDATAWGGAGGAGGDFTATSIPTGGQGGQGGAAVATLERSHVTIDSSLVFNLIADAHGGFGGRGGLDNPAFSPGPQAHYGDGGDGGEARSKVQLIDLVADAGDQNITLAAYAEGGRGGPTFGDGLSGDGGYARAWIDANHLSTGAQADQVYIFAYATGGEVLQPSGSVGAAKALITDNVVDLGSGDDTLLLSGGAQGIYGNSFFGGDGHDVLILDRATGLDMSDNTVTGFELIQGGDGDNVIIGAGSSPLTIDGGDGNDHIDGGSGNDILSGGRGDDTLLGGDGDDLIAPGPGGGLVDGGAGTDTVTYQSAGSGVSVNLSLGVAGYIGAGVVTTLRSIEAIIGSGHDDVLRGDSRANDIHGGGGNDQINGGGGDDRMWGGSGADTFAVTTTGFGGQVMDFSRADGDHLDLSRLHPVDPANPADQHMRLVAGGFTHHPGEVTQADAGGGFVEVEGDINGDAVADFHFMVFTGAPLIASDFLF